MPHSPGTAASDGRSGSDLVVDGHAHYLPSSAVRAAEKGGTWFGHQLFLGPDGTPVMSRSGRQLAFKSVRHMDGPEARAEQLDRLGIDLQVLSLVPPLLGYDLDPSQAVAMNRQANDDLAEIIVERPNRFGAFLSVPAQDPTAAVAELERAMSLAGFIGVELGSNVGQMDWGHPRLFPVLAAAEELDAIVFLHPHDIRAAGMLASNYFSNLIGNPLETTVAAASLIFSGVLDRLPRLRVFLCHSGGYLSGAAGRLNHGRDVRPENRDSCSKPPSEYLRRFWVDSIAHADLGLRQVVDQFGIDRVFLGTDYPADMGPRDPVGEITANRLLGPQERTAILGGNLERELGLG